MATAQFSHKYTQIDAAVNEVVNARGSYDTLAEAIAHAGGHIDMDDTPTEGSQNAVTSDGIYKALQAVAKGGSFSHTNVLAISKALNADIFAIAEEV